MYTSLDQEGFIWYEICIKKKAFLAVFNIFFLIYISMFLRLLYWNFFLPVLPDLQMCCSSAEITSMAILLVDNPKATLFRTAFCKVCCSTVTDVWQILDAKDVRMPGVTRHSAQNKSKKKERSDRAIYVERLRFLQMWLGILTSPKGVTSIDEVCAIPKEALTGS